MSAIVGFEGNRRFLSNFWPVQVELEGIKFPSVEHAYQAAKTLDIEARRQVAMAHTSAEAKKLGRMLKIRDDWTQVKEAVMRDLLIQKFAQAPFTTRLIETGDSFLEEANTWGDTYWGVYRGEGQNRLGSILMDIRADLLAIAK